MARSSWHCQITRTRCRVRQDECFALFSLNGPLLIGFRWVHNGYRADASVGSTPGSPTRLVPQSVKRIDVLKETFARMRRRNGCAVKIDILVAVVCAQADHVALIGHDVDQFELPVEAADSRIGLAKFLARLDGEAQRRR